VAPNAGDVQASRDEDESDGDSAGTIDPIPEPVLTTRNVRVESDAQVSRDGGEGVTREKGMCFSECFHSVKGSTWVLSFT
jgi:hypothetical protein